MPQRRYRRCGDKFTMLFAVAGPPNLHPTCNLHQNIVLLRGSAPAAKKFFPSPKERL